MSSLCINLTKKLLVKADMVLKVRAATQHDCNFTRTFDLSLSQLASTRFCLGLMFKAKLFFMHHQNSLYFPLKPAMRPTRLNKREGIWVHLRRGLNDGGRLVSHHLNTILKKKFTGKSGLHSTFIANHSACQAVKMEMCPAADLSPEDATAGFNHAPGEVFRFICLLKKVHTLLAQISRCSTSAPLGGQSGTVVRGPIPPHRILLTVCSYLGQKYSTFSFIMQNWLAPTFLMWCASRMSVNFQEIKKVCKLRFLKKNAIVMSQRGEHRPSSPSQPSETNLF